VSTATPPVSVVVLDGAITWTRGCLETALTSPLTLPTPCGGWLLGHLLLHMEDSLVALAEAAELGRVEVVDGDLRPGGSLRPASVRIVDRVVQRACRTREVWHARVTSAPISVDDLALGRDTVALVGALEIAVHGWDVAQATGHGGRVPEELAVRLLEVARAVVTPDERAGRFAPALAVPPSAPPSTRLLAHLGRAQP
jgi:uncharacterized protein (TIGR03086 family)